MILQKFATARKDINHDKINEDVYKFIENMIKKFENKNTNIKATPKNGYGETQHGNKTISGFNNLNSHQNKCGEDLLHEHGQVRIKMKTVKHEITRNKISSKNTAPVAHRIQAGIKKLLAVDVGSAWTRPTIKTIIVSMLRSDCAEF